MNDKTEFGPSASEDLPESVVADIEDGTPALKALRRWRGFSIDEMATASGVSAANIYGAETGRQLSLVAQKALAKALGVGLDSMRE